MIPESRGVPQKCFSEIRSKKKKPEGNELVGEASLAFFVQGRGPERRKGNLSSFFEVRTIKEFLTLEAKGLLGVLSGLTWK